MKNTSIKNILELNASIVLISSAGVLVRCIELDPVLIAFWRGILAVIILGVFVYFKKHSFKIKDKKDRRRLLLSSVLFGGHWITYFYALQVSSVAVGMLSMFTFPAITTLLEPIYFKTKFNKRHLILALVVLLGLYIMLPEINFSNGTTKGIIYGVFSALLYAIRNLTMKSNTEKYESSVLMFYQFLFIALVFSPFLMTNNTSNTFSFFPYILLLGIFTTAIGHTLFVNCFKNFNISTASIIASSQPVFGILLGVLFLNEMPNLFTIIGGALILSTVFIESISSKKE
jgi:drug/metabolite transporter (DMT)-like permease